MPEKHHWKKFINPDYLGAYSLDNGKGGYLEITPTISAVRVENVTGADGKKEDCMVMRFKEARIGTVDMKPMIVNVTNAKALEKLFKTPYVEDWSGRKVSIGVESVKAFGDVVDALRIRKTLPREQGAPKCLDCGGSIEATEKMNAAQLVAFGQKRYGKALCEACLRKVMEQSGAIQSASAQGAQAQQDEPEEVDAPMPDGDEPSESGESDFEKAMREAE
jgi:ribosomal protein L34E